MSHPGAMIISNHAYQPSQNQSFQGEKMNKGRWRIWNWVKVFLEDWTSNQKRLNYFALGAINFLLLHIKRCLGGEFIHLLFLKDVILYISVLGLKNSWMYAILDKGGWEITTWNLDMKHSILIKSQSQTETLDAVTELVWTRDPWSLISWPLQTSQYWRLCGITKKGTHSMFLVTLIWS